MDIPFRQYHHEMYLARQRSYHLALFVGLNNCFYKDMSTVPRVKLMDNKKCYLRRTPKSFLFIQLTSFSIPI